MTATLNLQPGQQITVDYTNYRGERALRVIQPVEGGLRFGSTEYHPEPQWLLEALDVEKGQMRTFALRDMRPVAPGSEPALGADERGELVRGAAAVALTGVQSERTTACMLRGEPVKRDPVIRECTALKRALRERSAASTDEPRILAALASAQESLGISQEEWLRLVQIAPKPQVPEVQELAWGSVIRANMRTRDR